MKKLMKLVMLVLSLTILSSTVVFAATENYVHKTPNVVVNVNTNSITLKIPFDPNFSRGKVVWQVQKDGVWQDIVYTGDRNATYFSGCSFGLGILKPSLSMPQLYRVTMTNSTTGVKSISDPVSITPYAKY